MCPVESSHRGTDRPPSGAKMRRPQSAGSAGRRNQRPLSARPATEKSGDGSGCRSCPSGERWECPAPRAMRPSSACSSASSDRRKNGRQMGDSPWVAYIGGGVHASYTALGGPQIRPQLADPVGQPAMPAHSEKVAIPSARALIDVRNLLSEAGGPVERRLTLCPQMRHKGFCRLPSCPFVHEVCRPKREFEPLYCAKAPRWCQKVPCRFFSVLGVCPHGENCAYSHEVAKAPAPPASALSEVADVAPAVANSPQKKDIHEDKSDAEGTAPSIGRQSGSSSSTRAGTMQRPVSARRTTEGRPGSARPGSANRKPGMLPMSSLGPDPDLGRPGKIGRPLSGGALFSARTVTGSAC